MNEIGYSREVVNRLTDRDRDYLFSQWLLPEATNTADQLLRQDECISLKQAREALLLSTQEVSRRMSISRNAYIQLEKRAENGDATVRKLQQAAAAIDCDLEVLIRPRNTATFAARIWVPLLNEAVATKWLANMRGGRLVVALPKRLRELLHDPKFRRAQKWSRFHHDGRRPPAWYL